LDCKTEALNASQSVAMSFAASPGHAQQVILSLPHLATIDHDVVVVAHAIDAYGAKGKFFESHGDHLLSWQDEDSPSLFTLTPNRALRHKHRKRH
jgi:hypothetical protein